MGKVKINKKIQKEAIIKIKRKKFIMKIGYAYSNSE